MRKLIFALLVLLTNISLAQTYQVSGFLADSSSGEKIPFATVFVEELGLGVPANEKGKYSIELPEGEYTFVASQLGYKTKFQTINVTKKIKRDFLLTKETTEIKVVEIDVDEKETDKNLKEANVGVMKIEIEEMNKVPVILGERDVLKTIQLLPGITSTGEGSSGIIVRGGNADQNLILLDDAPIYNASHILGFMSVFNSDALDDLKVYKAGGPAKYGGRSSSVIDVTMKSGDKKEYHGSGGIGLLSSRFTVEGPIIKEKSSFIVSGRRTYADMFLKMSKNKEIRDTKAYFYDLNFKSNYRFNDKNEIFLSGYLGQDVLKYGKTFGISYGNTAGTLRWKHLFNDKLISNTSLIYSKYQFGIETSEKSPPYSFSLESGVNNASFKQEFTYLADTSNKIKFGLETNALKFVPSRFKLNDDGEKFEVNTSIKRGIEAAVFVQNDQKIGKKLRLLYGLRLSSVHMYGPTTLYDFDKDGKHVKTHKFKNNEIYKSYYGLEPRVSSTYQVNKVSSVKASYARMKQYTNKISPTSANFPFDYWLPVSLNIKPGHTDQVSLGYHRNFAKNKFESFIEVYYKDMRNLLEYKDGTSPFITDSIESQLEFGKGRAYGVELFLKKRTGKFTGWISYTLSQSERQFDNINKGQWFLARQSRTHDLSIVAMYEVTKKVSLSASWVYYTGDAVTQPAGNYMLDGQVVQLFTERNGTRNPDYHRLDIGADFKLSDSKKFESILNVSIYNTYARLNAYAVRYERSIDNPEKIVTAKYTLLPFLPSVTWNFKF